MSLRGLTVFPLHRRPCIKDLCRSLALCGRACGSMARGGTRCWSCGRFGSFCLLVVFGQFELSAQVATSLGPYPYQNQLYNPAPNPVAGLTGSPQPKSIALFSGNVGATGLSSTPNDGTYFLAQSGFGQPMEEPRRPNFFIGQEIVPDAALGADLSKTPGI